MNKDISESTLLLRIIKQKVQNSKNGMLTSFLTLRKIVTCGLKGENNRQEDGRAVME